MSNTDADAPVPPDDPIPPMAPAGDGLRVTLDADREIVMWPLTTGDYFIEFKRKGDTYPLRLSPEAMNALVYLWHIFTWGRESVTDSPQRRATTVQPPEVP